MRPGILPRYRRGFFGRGREGYTAAVSCSSTVALAAGLVGEWRGIPTAVIALNLSIFCELVYLGWKVKGRSAERGPTS